MKKLFTFILLFVGLNLFAQFRDSIPNFKMYVGHLNIEESIEPFSKKYWVHKGIGLGLQAIAGVWEGLHQANRHHFYVMEEKWPNINKQWWGPKGWENKYARDENGNFIPSTSFWDFASYKAKYPGSTTVFVVFTDADHFLKSGQSLFTNLGVFINIYNMKPYKKLWYYPVDWALNLFVKKAAFELVHGVWLKP